jgi:hypothetical protein
MGELESRAWLLERFGDDGSALRDGIPGMLRYCHRGMADAQEQAPIKSQGVYGQMWRSVHEEFEERFGSLATVQLYRPKNAPYRVLVVNGTALFPWRYAHDARTELDRASFGPGVSDTRKAVLGGVDLPDMLPFGETTTPSSPEEAAEIERYRAEFRETAAQHPVVVVAYASNPDALLNAFWGDIKRLREDGTLEWGWREPLDIGTPTPPGHGLKPAEDNRPSFANAPLQRPVIRPRPRPRTGTPDNRGQADSA